MISAPETGEYNSYYQGYIDQAISGGPREILEEHIEAAQALTSADGDYAYAPGKWTIKELMQHIIDAERTFTYRIMAIARKDKAALPGFDQDDYAAEGKVDHRTIEDLVDEFVALRLATLVLIDTLPEDSMTEMGTASGAPVSVRALIYITAGHVGHHFSILAERYGVEF